MVLRTFPIRKTGTFHLKPKNSLLSGPRPGIAWLLLVYPGALPDGVHESMPQASTPQTVSFGSKVKAYDDDDDDVPESCSTWIGQ